MFSLPNALLPSELNVNRPKAKEVDQDDEEEGLGGAVSAVRGSSLDAA